MSLYKYTCKKKRKAGSGEKMRKRKGAPTAKKTLHKLKKTKKEIKW